MRGTREVHMLNQHSATRASALRSRIANTFNLILKTKVALPACWVILGGCKNIMACEHVNCFDFLRGLRSIDTDVA